MKAYNVEDVKKNWHMENELRKIANKETKRIKAILRPFIGEKVVIGLIEKFRDGILSKRIEKLITFDCTQTIKPLIKGGHASINHIYLRVSYTTMSLEISLCFRGGGHDKCTVSGHDECNAYTEYHKDSYYIASFHGNLIMANDGHDKGVLKEVYENHTYQINTLASEIRNYNNAVKAKKSFESYNNALISHNRL